MYELVRRYRGVFDTGGNNPARTLQFSGLVAVGYLTVRDGVRGHTVPITGARRIFLGLSKNFEDCVRQLLIKHPLRRLGAVKGAAVIKSHVFFRNVHWALLRWQTPPWNAWREDNSCSVLMFELFCFCILKLWRITSVSGAPAPTFLVL